MKIFILLGIISGLIIVFLWLRSTLPVWIRGCLCLLLLLVSCYFLSRLAFGPPVFYWQPPLMIPNTIFYLAPMLGGLLGMLIFNRSAKLRTDKGSKYLNSTTTIAELDQLQTRLQRVIETDQVYLKEDISLEGLANLLRSDRHTVSRLINERFGNNFFNFINSYRIRHFIHLVTNHPNQGFSKLAQQVGFRSKTSFIKAFKKEKHLTPTEFFKSQRKP